MAEDGKDTGDGKRVGKEAVARKVRVELEIAGVVNGVPVTVTGRGHVGEGRLDVELHADVVPLGFDPALVVLGALDVLLLPTCDGGSEDPVLAHIDFTLLDEAYRALGVIRMASRIALAGGRIDVRGQILEARTELEALERVTTVERVCGGFPVPLGRDGAVLTSTAAFETSFGHEYLSVAVSRIVGMGGGEDDAGSLYHSFAGAEVHEMTVERAGGQERDCRVMVGVEFSVSEDAFGSRGSESSPVTRATRLPRIR